MLLIRENKNGNHYGEYEDYTTTLYDAKTGKTHWRIKGKIERGLVEDDQLYVIKNGYPAAVDYKTGETLECQRYDCNTKASDESGKLSGH
ncbi:hypothetical protein Q0F98_22260 [Paenibacillus amylolyticus]|nr:hypothetical protein Q0F98_22260 [Paenibacillus amylolyticus]